VIEKLIGTTVVGIWGYLAASSASSILLQTLPTDPVSELISLGMGGALAGVMFWYTVTKEKQHTQERKEVRTQHAEAMRTLIERYERNAIELRERVDQREDRLLNTIEQVNETIRALKTVIDELSAQKNIEKRLEEVGEKLSELSKGAK